MTSTDAPNKPTLYRAVIDLEVKGRTIEGIAVPWETWAVVMDLDGSKYPEAHARSNFDESLRRDRGPRPLWYLHEWAFNAVAEPLGVTHFERSQEALMFRAFVSNTRKGREHLELVKDGATRDVSVGFRPLHSRPVQRPEGRGWLRTESVLRELSLAPTGLGQFPQAKVLALRARRPRHPLLDRLHAQMERNERLLSRAAMHEKMNETERILRDLERRYWR